MASSTFFDVLIIFLLIIFICFPETVVAHGTFYPHHVQDFGAIKDRIKELRGPVIITTSIFVIVLAGVIFLALRRGSIEQKKTFESVNARLKQAVRDAAKAAQAELTNDELQALRSALTAYAESVGIPFKGDALTIHLANASLHSPIVCKIRNDRVIAQVREKDGELGIEIRATCGSASARVFVYRTKPTTV